MILTEGDIKGKTNEFQLCLFPVVQIFKPLQEKKTTPCFLI